MDLEGLAPGRLIAQRYQLEKLLGEGGMGAVWSAVHTVTKKRVALKFLKANAATSPAHVRRFLREARAASAVRHPNVVEIHDIVELENGAPVMVMDHLVGESLAARLERQKVVPLAELATLLTPVISAVGTAHALGIVHRDIKPDNVFLEQSGDGRIVPRILDFGIAKLSAQEGAAAETATLTRTGSIMGTPYYMAPEQVFGERDIDQRADVWAFGVILYEALSGRRPVDGDNFGQLFKIIATGDIVPLARVAPQLPTDVTQLVERMLSKERQQRPQDLREVFSVLERYAQVSASSFDAPRPELEALRERGSAPSDTPVALTPAQFVDQRGGTELLVPTPSDRPPTSNAFSRSSVVPGAARSALPWWIGGAAAATLLVLGSWQFLRPDTAEIVSAVAAPPSVAPLASPTPVSVASPTPAASVSSEPVAAPAAAPSAPARRAEARPASKPVSSAPAVQPTPTPTPAAASRLPGGIAPQAPF